MADIDQASNQLQSMKNVLRQFKTASNAAHPAPEKLEKLKNQWGTIEGKVSRQLDQGHGRDWEPLKRDFRQLKDEFHKVERSVASKLSAAQADMQEREAAGNDPIARGGGGGGGAGGQMGLASGMAVNMAPLDTEEALQREKLQGVVEIEGQMNDLKSIYTDFNEMVHDQQGGLDTMETNVNKSVKHVEKGVVEIKKASEVQKSSRKWLCAIIVVVAILAVAGVIIGIVVGTSK